MSMGGVHAQRDSGARIACPFLDGKSNAYLKKFAKTLEKVDRAITYPFISNHRSISVEKNGFPNHRRLDALIEFEYEKRLFNRYLYYLNKD